MSFSLIELVSYGIHCGWHRNTQLQMYNGKPTIVFHRCQSFFFCCALFLPRTCANVCTMSPGQKGFERVSQTNRHWKGYKRWQFILEQLPLPVFCRPARNGPAVVSSMLLETHFKGTSYCELVKGGLEGRPNISDIKYFPPPQTKSYILPSHFSSSSISTFESVIEWYSFTYMLCFMWKGNYTKLYLTLCLLHPLHQECPFPNPQMRCAAAKGMDTR